MALALLGIGEAAPGAFPVNVSIEGHAAAITVTVDGETHTLSSVLGGDWPGGIVLEQPGPLEREYQIDGSDTTSTGDRDPQVIQALLGTPLYWFDAWLRDEPSLSRWEGVHVTDLATGQSVPIGSPLPDDFRVDARLRRPEAPARLWLVGTSPDRREGLELDRDRRNARWLIQRGAGVDALPRWFFPEQPAPFAAELLNLLGRAAAAAYALTLAALLLGWLFRRRIGGLLRQAPPFGSTDATIAPRRLSALMGGGGGRLVSDVLLAGWLLAAAVVTTRLYHQLPHILDAVSYTFQAGLFASGRISLPAPPLADAFKGPFEVVWNGQIFSQYPPGAPLVYALGELVHLEWLVGPLACLVLIGATGWTARALFGPFCGLVVVCLGVLSPFVLFQAGSYLSHPIAAGLLAGALAAFVAAERRGAPSAYILSASLLGIAFLTREAASVLFALPLGARLLAGRRWRALAWMVACGLPFLLIYLLYNAELTGNALLLPRTIFNPTDHFGFGDGIGFHTRHTLAAGLANTDELLTLLQFDLFGWPPLFGLALLGVPFLLGRFKTWDALAAGGFLAFVLAYAAYFYHGIVLGPRYYLEAMPWLLLLAGRGAQLLSRLARSRLAVALLLGGLSCNTLLFYLPAEVQRRVDWSALPGGQRISLDFVQTTLFGPQLEGVPSPALVVTNDWWLFNTSLVALNCPAQPDCGVLFALATSPEDLSLLTAAYPGRTVLRAVDNNGHIGLVPAT